MLIRKRTKTGIEMVKPFVGQFDRENFLLDNLGDFLMCVDIRTDVVSRKPRFAAL